MQLDKKTIYFVQDTASPVEEMANPGATVNLARSHGWRRAKFQSERSMEAERTASGGMPFIILSELRG
ncbi:hypothetical protein H0A61_00897 [Koleobacter methoxysyntrophicus]|jgi:hypothetical protein|uniref:Uncharacterized protein n=1 Tax=Koleobacter methoxysyntrophicus TaxID=2751313 RepID=A0A8A0RLT0_9FIRM|nr:hypothetical protein [Koleobacter methoxysyntrophicus]QSQ08570.1 hypothetical protein H0A61_00897 [Koleobacter methoxysyntrophicus]